MGRVYFESTNGLAQIQSGQDPCEFSNSFLSILWVLLGFTMSPLRLTSFETFSIILFFQESKTDYQT